MHTEKKLARSLLDLDCEMMFMSASQVRFINSILSLIFRFIVWGHGFIMFICLRHTPKINFLNENI